MSRIKCFVAAAVLCFPPAVLAQAFTFENLTPGQYSSISETIGTQTLTVTPAVVPPPVGSFLIVADPHVPLLGARSVVGLAGRISILGVAPIQFSFLNPVSAITFAFGDDGGDDDGPVEIRAFDAFNNLLGLFNMPYPSGKSDGATRTLTFSGAGASTFLLSSGSAFTSLPDPSPDPGSNFYWEVAASTPTAVPEPASAALVGTGLIFLGVAASRRRNRQRDTRPL